MGIKQAHGKLLIIIGGLVLSAVLLVAGIVGVISVIPTDNTADGGDLSPMLTRYTESHSGEHTYTEQKSYTAPTCTADGVLVMECSWEGRIGFSNYECRKRETQIIPALGHSQGSWVTTKAATCTATGSRYRVCTRCGSNQETETIPALGHNYVATVLAATCLTGGYTTHTCSRCANSYQDTYTAAKGHNLTEWVTTQEPSCVDGEYRRNCTACDLVETRVAPAIGEHRYGEWQIIPTTADVVEQRRICQHCQTPQTRTVDPYLHRVTLSCLAEQNLNHLTLSVTVYQKERTELTPATFLAYLNSLTTAQVQDLGCRGTVRYFDVASHAWCDGEITGVEQYDRNSFAYYLRKNDGLVIKVVSTISHLTATDTVQDLRTTA